MFKKYKSQVSHLIKLTSFFILTTSPSVILAQDSVVVFNEINYHPEGDDDSALEYVELYNQLAVDVDISNWRLDDGIEFNFPEGTVIGGREYLVIAKDPAALISATGISSALGPYSGSLSNGGETLILYNNNLAFNTLTGSGLVNDSVEGRRIMDQLEYDDSAPWPQAPDGSGFTLAKLNPGTGTIMPENWSTSGDALGTPGSVNIFASSISLALNEVAGSLDANFQIELHNYGSSLLTLDNLVICSSNEIHADYVFPTSNLSAGEFLTIDTNDLGYTPEEGDRLTLMSVGKLSIVDLVDVEEFSQARYPDGTGNLLIPDITTYGTANSVDLRSEIVINEIFYQAPAQRAIPASANINTIEVIDFDHSWRYNLDAGATGLPAGWATSSHTIDGVSWAQGQGLLGLENTTLAEPILTPLTVGSQQTYYFETEFSYNGSDTVTGLIVNHFTDDGAVFYLNGIEIERFNIGSAVTVMPSTLASPGVGNASLQSFYIASPNLLAGSNLLSVEVHQASAASSDVVFGANVQLNVTDGSSATPYLERDEEWIELYNRSNTTVDLSGWEFTDGIEYEFPTGTSLAAGEFLVIANDAAELSTKHPTANIIGDFDGKLSNGGERLLLEDAVRILLMK